MKELDGLLELNVGLLGAEGLACWAWRGATDLLCAGGRDIFWFWRRSCAFATGSAMSSEAD